MNVGFIALGKLGFPCALAAALRGHTVYGYDSSPERMQAIREGDLSFTPEPGIEEAYAQVKDRFFFLASLKEVVQACDLLLLSPATPHSPELDGTHPRAFESKDFDYTQLEACCTQVAKEIAEGGKKKTVVIISTCLPGTTAALSKIFNPHDTHERMVDLVYSPSFIAQSTVIRDYQEPEFALVGTAMVGFKGGYGEEYERYLKTIHSAHILTMSWESAELAKVVYNTFISFKIVLANTVMHMCHSIPGGNCDDVMDAISLARHRIVSPMYLRPGMGDGGGCHPRDNLAMSSLAKRGKLGYDPFEFVMVAREKQAEWLATLLAEKAETLGYPVIIIGKAFKPGVGQTEGSPSILVGNLLKEKGAEVYYFDSYIEEHKTLPVKPEEPAVFLLGVDDPVYFDYPFPAHSVIVDPWGVLDKPKSPTLTLIQPGR